MGPFNFYFIPSLLRQRLRTTTEWNLYNVISNSPCVLTVTRTPILGLFNEVFYNVTACKLQRGRGIRTQILFQSLCTGIRKYLNRLTRLPVQHAFKIEGADYTYLWSNREITPEIIVSDHGANEGSAENRSKSRSIVLIGRQLLINTEVQNMFHNIYRLYRHAAAFTNVSSMPHQTNINQRDILRMNPIGHF